MRYLFVLLCMFVLAACGGGGGGGDATVSANPRASVPPSGNELPLLVERWRANTVFPNQLYTTVQVCVPSSSTCQTIDHVLVDTGSFGLRLFDSQLNLTLPVSTSGAGDLYECARFVSGYMWGSVNNADVVMGAMKATVPVQVGQQLSSAPSTCAQGTRLSKPEDLGANGILGIGTFIADCGLACQNSSSPGMYYACDRTTCTGTTVALGSQVSNPVARLSSDNNGVVIDLTSVQDPALQAVGTLFLGIATRSNNDFSARQVLPLDANGYFVTTYKGRTFRNSYLDTGSNALFFQDASLRLCASGAFYCPASPQVLSATMTLGAVSIDQTFTVMTPPSGNLAVMPALAGPGGGLSFAWGLPFFYGKRVFTGFEQRNTAGYTGSFVAF